MALTPLQAASNLTLQASGARESLPQLIFVALHAANLGQLLKDVPPFFVRKTLLERSLFVTKTLDPGGEAWRRHMKQDVGTIHPVDMRHHGVKSMCSHLLKTEILLDTFMKKFHRPAHPVPCHNLACGGPQIIAGKILAATIRSVTPFRTHQLDLAYIAQVARGVSDAKVHSLAFVPTRRQTNGVPLEPAMTTEKRVDVAPLLRGKGAQRERFRFDTAGFAQGDNEVPAFVGNGLFDLFVVVAAIRQHQHLTPIVSANVVLQVERVQVGHDVLMFAVILEIMCLAIPLAIEGNRLEGNQHVTQHQDDIGPLMTDDIPLAVVERLGVFRVPTGSVLQCRINENRELPRQPVEALERLGKLPGLSFRKL